MQVIKKKIEVLYVRGITSVNKRYLEKEARKNKCKVSEVVNQILLKTRRGK